jgi:hypothetical protein
VTTIRVKKSLKYNFLLVIGDDGGYGDRECDRGSSGNGDSDGSGEVTKTTVATAMALGGKYNNQLKGRGRW